MKRTALWVAAGVLAGLILIAVTVLAQPYTYHGSIIDPPIPAPDFTLQQAGSPPFTLSEQKGKVVAMFFGYTTCPDVCPATLAEMRDTRALLKDRSEQVEFVFITVDPQRDTAEKMRDYVAIFDESFIGLSGTEAELEVVYDNYWVYRAIQENASAAGYLVDHTSLLYVIDPSGNLRITFPFGSAPEEVAADIRQLLKEGRSQ